MARQRAELLAAGPRRGRGPRPSRSVGQRIGTALKITGATVVGGLVLLLLIAIFADLDEDDPEPEPDAAGGVLFAAADLSVCEGLHRDTADTTAFAPPDPASLTDLDLGAGEGFGEPSWAAPAEAWLGDHLLVGEPNAGEVAVMASLDGRTRSATLDLATGAVRDELVLDAVGLGISGSVRWYLGVARDVAIVYAIDGTEPAACFTAERVDDGDPPLTWDTEFGLAPVPDARDHVATHGDRLHILVPTVRAATTQVLTAGGEVTGADLDGLVLLPPFVDEDHLYLNVSRDGGRAVAALDASTLTPAWDRDVEGGGGTWALVRRDDEVVVVTLGQQGATVASLDADDGEPRTTVDAGGPVHDVAASTSHVLLVESGDGDHVPSTVRSTPFGAADAAVGRLDTPDLLPYVRPLAGHEVAALSAPWWAIGSGARSVAVVDDEVVAWSEHALLGVIDGTALLLAMPSSDTNIHAFLLVAVPITELPPSGGGGGGDEQDESDADDDRAEGDGGDGDNGDGDGGGDGDGDDADGNGDDDADGGDAGGGGGNGDAGGGGGSAGTEEHDIDIDEEWLP